jgi:hypothetical protein
MSLACNPMPRVEAKATAVTTLLGDSLLGERDVE